MVRFNFSPELGCIDLFSVLFTKFKLQSALIDHPLKFKTIMGMDDSNLKSEIENILDINLSNDVINLINDYQDNNKRLYTSIST